MALPNTEKLTSQMAMMPDAALRQMAQMHKSDPYILPLIIAEDGRRKQMRMQSQAQQYRPQPKVAEAEAAQVGQLPENMGIGMLPTPNMAQMAGGGITGEDYDMAVGYSDGGVARFQAGGMMDGFGYGVDAGAMALDELRVQELLRKRKEAEDAERLKFLETAAPEVAARLRASQQPVPGPAPVAVPVASPAMTAQQPDTQTYRRTGGDPGVANRPTPTPTPTPTSGTRPGAGAIPTSLEAILAQSRKLADNTTDPRITALQKEVTEMGKEGVKIAEENERLTAERNAKFADAYKGREERLSKREGELEKGKDENTGLALLQAGLAIMSTPGNLATAVGKGGQAGLQAYSSGLERLRSAQEKLAEARDRLDDAKLNREETSAKEMQAAKLGVKQAGVEAKKAGIDFGMKALNMSREDSNKFVDASVRLATTQMEQAGQDRRAAVAAGVPGQQLQMAAALGGGTSSAQIEAGLRKMAEATTGKTDMRTLYATYLSGAQKTPGMDVMSFSQFVGQFAIPTTNSNNKPVAPGTTRERP